MPALTAPGPTVTLPEIELSRVELLMDKLRITRPFATLLLARDYNTSPALKSYLRPEWSPEPGAGAFHNGEALVERLIAAIRRSEPILVHGDYDVDGICGAVIYRRGLESLGGRVRGFLPSRFVDGYGVSLRAVQLAADAGIRLLLTADTGSQAYEAMEACDAAGIALCITDHHELGARLPSTPWFVNPMQPDCRYPYKGLSGGGIALKVVQSVAEGLGIPLDPAPLIPYATLSTIADVCPLTGENRALVTQGLRLMPQVRDAGLFALLEATRKPGQPLTARDLAFGAIPLLNAAGRMQDPSVAAQLLLTTSTQDAREQLARLQEFNRQRRDMTESVFRQAALQAEQLLAQQGPQPVLVVAAPQWHFGVVGIVAARLMEAYGVPAIVLTQHQEQCRKGPNGGPYLYTGSGRGPTGSGLLAAVQSCRAHIHHCGGHDAALGIGLDAEAIMGFREAICTAFRAPSEAAPRRTIAVDGQLAPEEITSQLLRELPQLEPCGAGNPPPSFLIGPMQIVKATGMKGDAHRSLDLADSAGRSWRGVQFGVPPQTPWPDGPIGVIGMPVENRWKGRVTTELSVTEVVSWPEVKSGSGA